VVRDLIGEDRLFEHPPKKSKGQPTFGIQKPPPPPHPLESGKAKKDFDKIVTAAQKLLSATPALTPGVLLTRLSILLTSENSAISEHSHHPSTSAEAPLSKSIINSHVSLAMDEGLGNDILETLKQVPVASLAELRTTIGAKYPATDFDQVILNLFDSNFVVLYQDANASQFSEAEKAQFVTDGGILFTSIARRSSP
jgi:hypothetical protein